MPFQKIGDLNMYYERTGSGQPMVLAHGSWGDHNNWARVVPLLSQSFEVVTYDRRGHSQSENGTGQGTFAEDADDLGGLIEALGVAPAYVIGNSGGAIIALWLAIKRPDLVRGLVVHEPPLVGLLEGRSNLQPVLSGFDERIEAVIQLLEGGDYQAAAQRFVNTIAFGPGAWDTLPQPIRDTFIRNAPTYLDETNDPEGLTIDLATLRRFDKPALVSVGTDSAPFFRPIAEAVAQALPASTFNVFEGAGHVPHLSHPEVYVQRVREFCPQRNPVPSGL